MGIKKCAICGKAIDDKEKITPYKKRFVHTECLVNMGSIIRADKKVEQKSKQEKKKEESKIVDNQAAKQIKISIPVSEKEYKEKRETIGYLEQLTNTPATAKAYHLLETYIRKYGFDYKGMYNALYYYYEVLNHPPTTDCVGIIPYIYEEAQLYMKKLEESEHINDDITSEQFARMYSPSRVIIKRASRTKELINIDEIK